MKLFATLATSALLLASTASFAETVTLGLPSYGGSGCRFLLPLPLSRWSRIIRYL